MTQRSELTRQRMNRMAQLLADGTYELPAHAAEAMGLTKNTGVRLWRSIRDDLGAEQCV